jgi:hypothetical protein
MPDHLLPEKLLRERDVAEQLAVEVSTLRRWRWAGIGPRFRKIGAAVRYHPADVADYVRAASRASTSDAGPMGRRHESQ